ncbi:hypothetical protein C8N24_1518 [Solirubrobacter pauli]|uniref:Uncharacterized protein n=1 Tax=Solirubrobacter pauli TaxID=166793 RepID=A0A660LG49_9ACTN|nr:hypothetical protein [Solirubrobacter pauli]RKQ91691.1 hypothetical protein C8N24_1518 [Solirubrobacter pauli]
MLARALAATGTERSHVLEVVQAEARGDARAVLNATAACARQPACVASTTAFVSKLERGGKVEILQYKPSVQLPLTRVTGTGRVAWRAGESTPVVQCVRVRRDGPASGAKVELLSISPPIGNEAPCP